MRMHFAHVDDAWTVATMQIKDQQWLVMRAEATIASATAGSRLTQRYQHY